MATVHLISGLPCSGKTTYSRALRSDLNSIHFPLDYWLITAFGPYSIVSVGHEEHVRRVLACRELIWQSAASFLVRGVDVILDDGFFFPNNRRQYIQSANELGSDARIHYLNTPVHVLRSRIERRNAFLPKYNFRIDVSTLNVFIGLFETPSAEEGASLVVVDGDDNSAFQSAPF